MIRERPILERPNTIYNRRMGGTAVAGDREIVIV